MTNQGVKKVAISGAYDAREILKSHGGKWDSNSKSWLLTEEQFNAVDADIEGLRDSKSKTKVAIVKSWDLAQGRWFAEPPKSPAQISLEIDEQLAARDDVDEKIQKVRMGVMSADDAMNED
jgi:hypothetical protein